MINTIFYFPESLTFNEYINKLDKDTDDGISKRTIVFAEEQGRIYKNGQIYGTNTYDVQNLIELNRYNDEYVRTAIEQLEHDLQEESDAIDLQGLQYLALAGRVKTIEDHGYVNEAEILTAVTGEIDGSTQKSSIRNKINNVAKEASAALFTEVSDSNDYITAQSIVNAITTNTAARANLASSFTSGDNQMWAGALTQADLTNSSSALYAALRDKANDNEVVKQASVIASINSSGESNVSISADKIDVDGIHILASNVTGIDNLVANQINSAYINAEHINSGVLSADRLNISQIVGKLVDDSTQMLVLADNLNVDSDSLYVRTATGIVMADINGETNRHRVHFLDGLFQMDYADYKLDGTPSDERDAYLLVWNAEGTKLSALGCVSLAFQDGQGKILGGCYGGDISDTSANGGHFHIFAGRTGYGTPYSEISLNSWGTASVNDHLGYAGFLNGMIVNGTGPKIGMSWHGDMYAQKLVAVNATPWGVESSFNDTNATVIEGSGVTANQFVKRGSNDNYVLLAGGGVKALSDFTSGTGTGSGNSGGTVAWNDVTGKPNFASVATSGSYNDLSNKPTIPDISGKQDTLVSGTNIKTINNQSILGSGNITISGGSGGSGDYLPLSGGTLTGGLVVADAENTTANITNGTVTLNNIVNSRIGVYSKLSAVSGANPFEFGRNATAIAGLDSDCYFFGNGFKATDSSDEYVLLGGGGTAALSGFATTSALAGYLPLTGGTVTGNLGVLNSSLSVVTAGSSNTSYTTTITGSGVEARMTSTGTPIDYRTVLTENGLTLYDQTSGKTVINRTGVTADGFIANGSSDEYVLLGGGGTKALSEIGGGNGGGSGTVTSIAAGTGLTGGTITTTGTLAVDTEWLAAQCLTIPSTGAIDVPKSLEFGVDQGLRLCDSGNSVDLKCNEHGLYVDPANPAVQSAIYANGDVTINGDAEVVGNVNAADLRVDNVSVTSDEKLKNKADDVELSAEQIAEAPAIKFTWKDENKDKNVHVGTIAQYWQNIIPETVSVDKYGNLALDYQGAAMAAVINLAKEVVELKAKIAELESKLNNA